MGRQFTRYTGIFAVLYAVVQVAIPRAAAQTDSGSSLKELDSNSLLGGSFNDKEFGTLPTHITSDTLTLNNKTRVFVYKGNVVVKQGDMTLTSKEIEGTYSEQNEIQKIIAKGDVVIVKQDITSTSQRATYDAPTSIITLTDNPQLQQGESTLIADRIKVFLNDNRSQAEGNVRVTFVKLETPSPAPTSATAPTSGTPEAKESPIPTPNTTPTAVPKNTKTPAATQKPAAAKQKPTTKKVSKKPNPKKTAPTPRPGKS